MKKSGVLFFFIHTSSFFYDNNNNNIGGKKLISFNLSTTFYFTHAGLGENSQRGNRAATGTATRTRPAGALSVGLTQAHRQPPASYPSGPTTQPRESRTVRQSRCAAG
jgi:hypothetical protein